MFLMWSSDVRILFLTVFQINLRLILVSGKTKEFLFSPNDSAADIAKHVYDNWPMGKWLVNEKLLVYTVSRAEITLEHNRNDMHVQ